MDYPNTIAKSLLTIGAVGFSLQKPITFKSGIKSPVYVDNRRFPFYPEHWKNVILGFTAITRTEQLNLDAIAGIETAGIPHSAALGFYLDKPSVFVRKSAKDHGTKKMIEGGDVDGMRVLLIEDHVSTGSSSLAGVDSLRAAGALVTDCLSITNYEFEEARVAFTNAKIKLHTLTNFSNIFAMAIEMGKISQEEVAVVKSWIRDPHGWSKNYE